MVRITGMTVSWTRHRFQGGVLALDAANTVVLRGDAARTFDRFEDPLEIACFAEAASLFRADELGGRRLAVADPLASAPLVLSIRETTDRLFRNAVHAGGGLAAADMTPFLRACADGLACADTLVGAPGRPFGDADTPVAVEAALATSALSLLAHDRRTRLKVCRNCNWLFLDRSRNGSRLWCDMAVCGNRRKASRHYRRRKAAPEVHDA